MHFFIPSNDGVRRDIRGVGLQVGFVNTEYYVSDSLTYVPSENRGVGLQVYMTTDAPIF
jgi:hypothetical protein